MDIPVQVAVRVFPNDTVKPVVEGFQNNVITVKDQSFPFTKYFGPDTSQNDVYSQTVVPFLGNFLEGFDLSLVMYGQKGTGKTYTMYGPTTTTTCMISETEYGICHRFLRDIFTYLTHQTERIFYINIGWTEISKENEVKDLLNNLGLVQCYSLKEALDWIQHGLANRSNDSSHNILSLILEQQWVMDGLFQHRLSTISFCDLCPTDRQFIPSTELSIPRDVGLKTLEEIINAITDDSMDGKKLHENVNYNKTILTSFLKDSFGGRAQTVLFCTVSTDEVDLVETLKNLQFAFKTQSITNHVVMNTYTDNNLPFKAIQQQQQHQQQQAFMAVDNQNNYLPTGQVVEDQLGTAGENFQFAAQQWLKLLKNAEGLFQKLAGTTDNSKELNNEEKLQIQEWLLMKAECDDCLNSNEFSSMLANPKSHSLLPIQEEEQEPDDQEDEDDEDDEEEEEDENNGTINSSDDSEAESTSFQQLSIMEDKIDQMLKKMQTKTDLLVRLKYADFLKSHPTAVTESLENAAPEEKPATTPTLPTGGRRKSIQPGHSLSSIELDRLQHVATLKGSIDSFGGAAVATDLHKSPGKIASFDHKLIKCTNDIEALTKQIAELEQTTILKQKLINDLLKNNDTRNTAKQRFTKKKIKLEADYEKAKKQLSKAVVSGRDKSEIERLEVHTSQLEQRLQDLASIKHIAGGSSQKIKQLQVSVQDAKKQMQQLQKSLKKEKKYKDILEKEVEKSGGVKKGQQAALTNGDSKEKLRDMNSRISHLDHILKEKSNNLQQYSAKANVLETSTSEKESLRHEIRNLRRTRDHLLDQRCSLDKKLKKEKMLSYTEERKLMECDEAIEAIDATIELKNEMICGRRSIDTDESLQREKGEQMLMARLNRLSEEEMRTLLYKYFQKVIDLRDSSRKLEIQLIDLERDKDALEWREKILTNALRQARLEGERNLIVQQRQHETKLNLMLRHFASETGISSSSFSDKLVPMGAAGGYASSDLESMYSPLSGPTSHHHGNLNLLQLKAIKEENKQISKQQFTRHLESKAKEQQQQHHETKNKLFAKFQVLTKYQGSTSGQATGVDKRGGTSKNLQEISLIPEQSLKQLQSTKAGGGSAFTKVTRQKNKIIIQQNNGN